jgi:hypothetical protein
MRVHTLKEIRKVYDAKGYTFYTKGLYNLNIIGVRSSDSKSDKFDDHLHLIYRSFDNQWKHYTFNITTDPGKYWLNNPFTKKGTAILVPYQYKGVFQLGIHGRSHASGGYEALEQVKPMMYVRDNNKDDILNFDLYEGNIFKNPNVFQDNIKSNIHRASQWKTLLNVGRYSAACQVIQQPTDFDFFIKACKKSKAVWGNSFSYTLLEEKLFDL